MKKNERGEIMEKGKKKLNGGIVTLIICGIIAMALIIGCVFFPEEIFGIFTK